MNRRAVVWVAFVSFVVGTAAMYVVNPFHAATRDPRARVLGLVPYRMPSRSMEPTIHENSVFFANIATLRSRDPRVGEIIVFEYPANPQVHYIKRVVAVGGTTLEMRKGVVYLDGAPLAEPYLPIPPLTQITVKGEVIPLSPDMIFADYPPTLVPENHFFVLGDSRGNSDDSRSWGFVPRASVIGSYTPLFGD